MFQKIFWSSLKIEFSLTIGLVMKMTMNYSH